MNDLIPTADSWTITDARGISDNGLIAAKAERSGESRPVLLVPLPVLAAAAARGN